MGCELLTIKYKPDLDGLQWLLELPTRNQQRTRVRPEDALCLQCSFQDVRDVGIIGTGSIKNIPACRQRGSWEERRKNINERNGNFKRGCVVVVSCPIGMAHRYERRNR